MLDFKLYGSAAGGKDIYAPVEHRSAAIQREMGIRPLDRVFTSYWVKKENLSNRNQKH